MPNLDNERATVQNPLVQYAVDIGWVYLSQDEALTLRQGESGLFLYETLRRKLIDLNPGIVTVANVDAIIGRIESPQQYRGQLRNAPMAARKKIRLYGKRKAGAEHNLD